MPTIYLICLSIMLSPITFILLIQNIKFHKSENTISRLSKKSPQKLLTSQIIYEVSQLYMQNHEWYKAIIILDNLLIEKSTHELIETAKCYNSIGIVLQKNSYKNLADKYYQEAVTSDSYYDNAINKL